MQARMKEHPLSEQKIQELLREELVGRLATAGKDGYPYITPVHYVHMDGRVYIHGLAAGEKLVNIKENPLVGFEVEKMGPLVHADEPCNTNTAYESVIIKGKASLVADAAEKTAVLDVFVVKYTPQHAGKPFPANMVKMTAVIAVTVDRCTGKYYPVS